MIQVYNPDNTNFNNNGDMTLNPSMAEVQVVLNDLWGATLRHPIDQEGRWKYLVEDAVIKMPSFNGEQLFRIRKVKKTDSSIDCVMEPIFFDSIDDCFLQDIRPTDANGQLALNAMLAPNRKYFAVCNIKKIRTAYYQDVNFMEALNGNIDQSFVKRWGGEICYDNFKVIVNEKIGFDNGVEICYGKNIRKNGLTEEVDTREVVTRIRPKAYNGRTMSGIGYVDSPNISKFPTVRMRVMKFEDIKMAEDCTESDRNAEGIIVCNTQNELDAALREKCLKQYELGIDRPKVTINADIILLQNTDLYEDFAKLEKISLGDTVHCRHEVLGIVSDARVISLTYDSLREKVTKVTLGDYQSDYFDNLDSMTGRIESEVGNLIDQIENPNSEFHKSMQKLIDEMAASIAGYNGGNMLITKNSDGKPNGIMIMDTDSKDTAKKILYFNLNGITYSSNGANGPFNAVWSFEKGGFVADWIVAGTMMANIIKGGVLTLGGAQNGNGLCKILDAEGNTVATLGVEGIKTSRAVITGGSIKIKTSSKDYSAIDLKGETAEGSKYRIIVRPGGIEQYVQYDDGERKAVDISGGMLSAGSFTGDIFGSPNSNYNKWVAASGIYDGDAFSGSFYDKDSRRVEVSGGLIRRIK